MQASLVVADPLLEFASIPLLRLGGTTQTVGTAALVTSFDGISGTGAGLFINQGATGAADDGGDVIVSGSNVWIRQTSAAVATDFGAKGNGTDDGTALQLWFNAVGTSNATNLVLPNAAPGSAGYMTNSPLVLHNGNDPPVGVWFGATIYAGPLFPAGNALFTTTGGDFNLYDLALDGTRNGAGSNYAATGWLNNAFFVSAFRPKIQHCSSRLADLNTGSGVYVWDPLFRQWVGTDIETLNQANLTAQGFRINTADGMIHGGECHNTSVNVYVTTNGHTFYAHEFHPYNGSANTIACTAVSGDGTHVTYTLNTPIVGALPSVGTLLTATGFSTAGYNVSAQPITSITTGTITIANTTTGASTTLGGVNTVYLNPVNYYIEPGGEIYTDDCYHDNGKFITYSSSFKIVDGSLVYNTNGSLFSPARWLEINCDNKNHPFQCELDFDPVNFQQNNIAIVTMLPGFSTAVSSTSVSGSAITYNFASWPYSNSNPKATQNYLATGFLPALFNTPTTGAIASSATGTTGAGSLTLTNATLTTAVSGDGTHQTYTVTSWLAGTLSATSVSGDGTHQTYTIDQGWAGNQPIVGSRITTAAFTVGGYNVTNALVTASTPTTVSVSGATTGASATLGTVSPDNRPQAGDLITTTGFSVAGYNVTAATVTSSTASTVLVAGATTGGSGVLGSVSPAGTPSTLGIIAPQWVGDYSKFAAYSTGNVDSRYVLNAGNINFHPESTPASYYVAGSGTTAHPGARVEVSPGPPIREVFDVGNAPNPATIDWFPASNPLSPAALFTMAFLQVQRFGSPGAGNSTIVAGSATPAITVAATGASGNGTTQTYTVASWPNGVPGVGTVITLSGFTTPGYNGVGVFVSAASPTTVSILGAEQGASSAGSVGYATDEIAIQAHGDGTASLLFRNAPIIDFTTSQIVAPTTGSLVSWGSSAKPWQVVVGNFLQDSTATGLVASTTHTRPGATQMTAEVNVFATVANASDSGTLPALVAGMHADVYNSGAHPMLVFPNGASDNIDGAGAGASVTLTNGLRCRYSCVATNVIVSAQLGAASA